MSNGADWRKRKKGGKGARRGGGWRAGAKARAGRAGSRTGRGERERALAAAARGACG